MGGFEGRKEEKKGQGNTHVIGRQGSGSIRECPRYGKRGWWSGGNWWCYDGLLAKVMRNWPSKRSRVLIFFVLFFFQRHFCLISTTAKHIHRVRQIKRSEERREGK